MTVRAAALALVAAAATAARAGAQTDYRNLEAGRPLRIEDAYPIERHGFELSLLGSSLRRAGADRAFVTPALEYGIARNAQIAMATPLTDTVTADSGWAPAASFEASILWNLRAESPSLPALSALASGGVPLGGFGAPAHGSAGGLLTRSFGRWRVHANAEHRFGPDAGSDTPRWWYGVATDRTDYRHSNVTVLEVRAERATNAEPIDIVAGLGTRDQWRPTLTRSAGVALRFSPHRKTGIELHVGLSHAFGIRALMPRAPAARPASPLRGRGRDEQFYLPGDFNWRFLKSYPSAARLFNAFDYGHAVLYERLYTLPDSARAAAALEREYAFLTTDLLVRPPRYQVAEEAIAPAYAKLAWRAMRVFDWAHVLHRQIYDVYADERLTGPAKDSLIERLTDYYLSNARYALAPVPKAMSLMDEQYYSGVFRRRHPAFNGLIWAYHWLQVGLYEPLILGQSADERRVGVDTAVARFWQMLRDPPATMPRVMPMTATIAPHFTEAHPRAAAIFDNLHMLHDVISDILAADTVPRDRKGAVIGQALDEFQNVTWHVMTRRDWLMMGAMMGGIEAMGGPPTGARRTPADSTGPDHRHH